MFIYQVVFCLSRLFAAVAIVSPVSIPAIAPHSLHIRPFFYSVIPASEPGSWAALCEVLHCAVALPSSSSPAPPRVRLRANWAAVRQSVQARLHSPCTNCPHQVRDDGAIAPLYHCLRHCHPRQRLPGCRLGGRHDGAVGTTGDAARNVSTMRRLCCWHYWRRCTQRLYHVLPLPAAPPCVQCAAFAHYAPASAAVSAPALAAAATPARLASTSS